MNIKNTLKNEDIDEIIAKSNPLMVINKYTVNDSIYGECPSCGHSGLKQGLHEYCFWCGQRLNWNKEKIEPLVVYL